jgi:hypothetical protein
VVLLVGVARSRRRGTLITDGADLRGRSEGTMSVWRSWSTRSSTAVRSAGSRSTSGCGRKRATGSSAEWWITAAGSTLVGRGRCVTQLRQGVGWRRIRIRTSHLGRARRSADASGIRKCPTRFLARARLGSTRGAQSIALVNAVGGRQGRGLLRVQLSGSPIPVNLARGSRSLRGRANWSGGCSGGRAAPLRSRGSPDTGCLVSLRVDILRLRSRGVVLLSRARQLALEKLQTSLDVDVGWVEISGPTVRIESVGDLVVARLVQGTQIIPDLRDVWVQANRTRVSVKRIAVLVDLVIEDTNRAPEGGVATIAVDRLLVGFVCLWVLSLRHVAATEQIPALSIIVIWIKQVPLVPRER